LRFQNVKVGLLVTVIDSLTVEDALTDVPLWSGQFILTASADDNVWSACVNLCLSTVTRRCRLLAKCRSIQGNCRRNCSQHG